MLFPQARATEAQGVHSGYTYTQRVCREYGQQPRWYNVRGEMAGSDWRSNGGWAIVLERGSGTTTTVTFTQGNNPERTISQYNNVPYLNGGLLIENSGGPWDGYQGVIALGAQWDLAGIDANRDGQITAADQVYGSGINRIYLLFYSVDTTVSGGSYIRWANMTWCR